MEPHNGTRGSQWKYIFHVHFFQLHHAKKATIASYNSVCSTFIKQVAINDFTKEVVMHTWQHIGQIIINIEKNCNPIIILRAHWKACAKVSVSAC